MAKEANSAVIQNLRDTINSFEFGAWQHLVSKCGTIRFHLGLKDYLIVKLPDELGGSWEDDQEVYYFELDDVQPLPQGFACGLGELLQLWAMDELEEYDDLERFATGAALAAGSLRGRSNRAVSSADLLRQIIENAQDAGNGVNTVGFNVTENGIEPLPADEVRKYIERRNPGLMVARRNSRAHQRRYGGNSGSSGSDGEEE